MIPISICIIMKNEEKKIAACLSSLHDVFFNSTDQKGEIIVVDTGSTDQSIRLASAFVSKVHHFEWINDFAAAKNYAASLASNDMILILDADESLTFIDHALLQQSMLTHPKAIGQLSRDNLVEENGIITSHTDRVERLYDRRLFHFIHPIHEQLVPIQEIPIVYYPIPVQISHTGYLLSQEELCRKAKRNNQLLFKELHLRPKDPYLHYQIGQSYLLMRDYNGALPWFEKGLQLPVDPGMEYVQMMLIGYGECLLALDRAKDALSIADVYESFKDTPEYLFLVGQIYLNNDMYLKAYGEFLKCLSMKPNRTQGVTTYFAYHNIAVINELLGNKDMAITFYEKAGDYPRSADRLKELKKQ
ncbi:MAG TPA: glycosyltransferase [Lachnospiraceae bacterium]|nr:glycosyltransferase [Lachnospiraceae bacterium]